MPSDAAVRLVPRSVPAVARAAGILRALAGRREATLTDLARTVGIYKSTAHGILGTLSAFDLVERDPQTRRYRLGPALVTLGRAAQDPDDLGVLARPHLVHLSRLSAETVALHIPDGEGSVIVASEESPQRLKVSAPTGFHMPARAGAVAKVLEAFDPAPRTRPAALPAFTGRSITQADRWDQELDKVRRAGFALDDMEFQDGIRAVSAPVLAGRPGRQELVAAYSIIAVASRVSIVTLRKWVPALLASARGLAGALRQSREHGTEEDAP
ncbi:MAG TPA: IclR family transcriptional regulator [bacterium]|nr:IclR family transcriptional regulator [bacterium]